MIKKISILCIILVLLLISGCVEKQNNTTTEHSNVGNHVIFIAFENHGYNAVTSNPYFDYLAQTYGVVTNYRDLKHAGFCSNTHSLPNYMAITSGSALWNGVDKCGTDSATWGTDGSNNIFTLVSSAGLTYGSWAENAPNGNCVSGSGCITRHVPALFYTIGNNLKDYSDWDSRILKGSDTPPSFSFITPNGCDSAHDCSVSSADTWLKNTFNLPALLQKPWASNSVFILWFDESESEPYGYLVFVCPSCQGTKHTAVSNNYNLMTTIEWALGTGNTGNNDNPTKYPPMTDLFGQ